MDFSKKRLLPKFDLKKTLPIIVSRISVRGISVRDR